MCSLLYGFTSASAMGNQDNQFLTLLLILLLSASDSAAVEMLLFCNCRMPLSCYVFLLISGSCFLQKQGIVRAFLVYHQEKMVIFLRSSGSSGARRTQGSSHSPLKLAKVLLLKDGMKAFWECRLEKLLGYGALLTMLMVLVDSQHGVFSPTRFWFLRLKF
ncbi:hypothetical protein LOK49_LG12G00327 [Camellia lanceoleosa]|uniref:Uncharacterized protein n=1 Tax=Camellia lanceoleosa TaxID=1840588 RepID=A0ACC0FPE6_9ERIC|nr:hypothetical protein LOK49_LG12G00327 [Camellia lanceoleosa]